MVSMDDFDVFEGIFGAGQGVFLGCSQRGVRRTVLDGIRSHLPRT